MKKISVMLIGLSSLICGCTNCDTKCENPWQSLLGENLSQADFDPQVWSIDKDGVISATKDQLICTKKDWQNFELELEFKLFEGSNSGVVIYISDKNWIPNSLEVQIADNKKFAEPRTTCGSIYGTTDSKIKEPLAIGVWHKMKIRANGQMVDVWINGQHATQMDMSKWTDVKFNPDGSKMPPWIAKRKKCEMPTIGKIGLQGKHGKALINYRNVKIRNICK
ncbi:MAG: DUF1080 domain-containing protein [Opitutales bacterium]|nr:DUF1080 domain-containing protein [Opitutales bacterium]